MQTRLKRNERPLRPKFDEYIFQWSARFSLACFFIGATLIPLVLEILQHPYTFYKVFTLSGLVAGGIGAAWALWDRADRFDDIYIESLHPEPLPEIKPMPETEPKREHSILLNLGNGHEAMKIWQPRPASFSSWLSQVVADNNKVQFSENQAKIRDWPIERYHVLIAQLRQIGLLHNQDMRNNAPVLTEQGKHYAREWLKKNV